MTIKLRPFLRLEVAMLAVAVALFAAIPAAARAAGEESAGGGSTPGEAVPESPGASTEPPSTGWTGGGGSTGASSGGGAATPGTSLGSGGGQVGSTGGEHSSNTGSSTHSAPEPSYSAPEPSYSAPDPTYSAPEPSGTPSSEEQASTFAPSSQNGPATTGKGSDAPATKPRPVKIGLAAASVVAVSQTPPAPIGSLTPESAAPDASSGDQVASGNGGLPFGVVILLALFIACAAGLGIRDWDRRRKPQTLEAGPGRAAESEAATRRIEMERAAAAFFEKGNLTWPTSKSNSPWVAWRKPLRVFSKR